VDEAQIQQVVPARPEAVVAVAGQPVGREESRPAWTDWLTTTDHKKIGTLYLVTAFVFFLVGGVMALLMRAELARPGMQIMSQEQFNQAFRSCC
jgi:cytochrome c oxidase subunit I